MTEELFSNSMAAQFISDHLPEKTPAQWGMWLQNNRNQSRRVPFRIPVRKLGGGVFYAREDLERFVEFEEQRQIGTIKLSGRAAEALHAFGAGLPGASATGRQWKGGHANLGEDGGVVFIQTVITEPLLVFAMTPEQAIEFGRELVEAGEAAARIVSGKPACKDSEYSTVMDTPEILIKRKEGAK